MATSWIDQVSPLAGGADTRAVLDALEDADRARAQELHQIELELLHRRLLVEVLDEERARLERDRRRLEDTLADLDAEMHLALARDREDRARAAILRIIPLRRRLRPVRLGIDRIDKERRRLAATLGRHAKTLEQRSTAQPAHGRPGSPREEGPPAGPGRVWTTTPSPTGEGGF